MCGDTLLFIFLVLFMMELGLVPVYLLGWRRVAYNSRILYDT